MLGLDSALWVSKGEHHHHTRPLSALPSPATAQSSSGIKESPPDGSHSASPRTESCHWRMDLSHCFGQSPPLLGDLVTQSCSEERWQACWLSV